MMWMLVAVVALLGSPEVAGDLQYSECRPDPDFSIWDFFVTTVDGLNISLSNFRSSVLLIVNTATYSDYADQYLEMNKPIVQYGADNFFVLAFPSNQFGLREPGNNDEILAGLKYIRPGNCFQPEFLIMEKTDVNGPHEHPIYSYLKGVCISPNSTIGNPSDLYWSPIKIDDVSWNFEKFLIGRDGKPRYRFQPSTTINDITPFIERLLAEEKDMGEQMPTNIQKILETSVIRISRTEGNKCL